MENKPSLLDGLTIASPCTVSWDSMKGDARVRSCDQCRLNVYNISEMSKTEAEGLIREKEGRLCVRFYRRADGTILTNDCPVGLRAARLKLARFAASTLALIAVIAAGVGLRRRTAVCPVAPALTGFVAVPVRATMGEAVAPGRMLMGAPPPMTAIMGKVRANPQPDPVEKPQ